MYLRHVEGHYSQGGGCTPLALLWKDESCSRYLLVSCSWLGALRDCCAGHATRLAAAQARVTCSQ
jgi:hypothetical protein